MRVMDTKVHVNFVEINCFVELNNIYAGFTDSQPCHPVSFEPGG
jgi:hypothetical protein